MLSARTTRYSVWLLLAAFVVLSHAQDTRDPGTAPDSILALDPRWTVTFNRPAVAPAGFDQEAAYVPLEGGTLIAIDLERGAVRWQTALSTSTTPATGDGMVFAATTDHTVLALDQRSGAVLWRMMLPTAPADRLYWDSGWVFASTNTGELMAVRAQDGHVVWRRALGARLAVRPSPSGDHLYVALDDGRLAALSLETGEPLWTLTLDQEVTGLLALEEQLLAGTRANVLHSISVDRGRIRWTQRAGADVMGAPVADEHFIYFVAFDNVLRALNRSNGNLRWTRNLPSRPSGGALRVDDVVLVPFSTTDIGAYLAATGAPAFTIRAAGELGGGPFIRENTRPTATRLVAISREGNLQGFAARFEQPLVPLAALPGVRVGG